MRRLALTATALALAAAALVAGCGGSGGGPSGPYQVRAIFDDAAFAVPGEQVRIAGAPVGAIAALDVTKAHRAAVILTITTPGFTPFHADATCAIRPQSLIAERYVDCTPGTAAAPPLQRTASGAHLLPVDRTSSPIDPDIVQNISRQPIRERLAIILNELGTGLAGRGADLNAVIRRADPALGYTDQAFRILADQNRTLAKLATDSDAVLQPLATARQQLAGFVVNADTTAVASAQRSAQISQSIKLLPPFLTELKPLMADLGTLAGQGTPLMASLSSSAAAVDRQFAQLIPFANAARTALIDLGAAAQRSQSALIATRPLAQRLDRLGAAAQPSARSLDALTHSLDTTGGIEQLMAVLFHGVGATNGFDSQGHYVRTDALFGSCTAFARSAVPGCSANFSTAGAATASAARGLLQYLLGK